MLISDVPINLSGARLLDLDLRDGVQAALVERAGTQEVLIGDWIAPVPKTLRFPIVRLIDKTTAIVLDTRTTGAPNAWIVNADIGVTAEFLAGDAITDVACLSDLLAISYFDEGIFGHVEPSPEGIAVFSLQGAFLWGYHSTFRAAAQTIDDCYCMCVGPDERLWFHPYSDFTLVALDCRSQAQEVLSLPRSLAGSKAISTDGSQHWFFSPGAHESELFSWKPSDGEPKQLATLEGRLRGLPGGRFMTVTPSQGRIAHVAA